MEGSLRRRFRSEKEKEHEANHVSQTLCVWEIISCSKVEDATDNGNGDWFYVWRVIFGIFLIFNDMTQNACHQEEKVDCVWN